MAVAITLVLVTAGVVAWKRLGPVGAAQARALAELQPAPPASVQHNAWPRLWLLDVAIPPGEVARVYEEDRRRMQRLARHHDQRAVLDYVTAGTRRYGRLPALSAAQRRVLCWPREEDCLAKARAHVAAWDQALAQQAARLRKIQALARFDALDDTLPVMQVAPPMPLFSDVERLTLSDAALRFVRGDTGSGLDAVCGEVTTWRRLRRHSNRLSLQLLAEHYVRDASHLLAEMLAELPDDAPLPPSCTTAYAPVTLPDVDRCPVMGYYLQHLADAWRQWDRHASHRTLVRILFDQRSTLAAAAPHFAAACTANVRDRMIDDGPFGAGSLPDVKPPGWTDWLSNPLGSFLYRRELFGYEGYLDLAEDYAATLRLMRLRLWLREPTARALPPAIRLQAALKSVGGLERRDVALDADGRHLRMPLYRPLSHPVELVWPMTPALGASAAHATSTADSTTR